MQTLKMDFQSQSTPPVVPVMQSDAQSRFIGISLYNGGVPYEAPEGASYTVQYRGPGANNMGWYDTITLSSGTRKAVIVDSASKNVVTLELAEQALRVNGNVFVNLCVVTNTGYMLKTFPIICRVTGAAFPDTVAVLSFFYVTGITSEQWLAYVTACQDAQKRAEAAAAKFEIDPTLSVSGKAADAANVGMSFENVYDDFLFSENGIKKITITAPALKLYKKSAYIDNDAKEMPLENWDIYEYALPFSIRIIIKKIERGTVNGVNFGAVNDGMTNYPLDEASINKVYNVKSIKINAYNGAFTIKVANLELYHNIRYGNAISTNHPWKNCDKLLVFGDSIFCGYGATNNKGVTQIIAENLNLTIDMQAIPSATLTYHENETVKSVTKQVEAYTKIGNPIVMINGGTNDQYQYGYDCLGTYGENNVNTIYGATKYIIETLMSKGIAPQNIVVVTPIPKGLTGSEIYRANIDAQLKTIGYAMWTTCCAYGVNCINGYLSVFGNIYNTPNTIYLKQLLLPDDTHPSTIGAKYFANNILGQFADA